MKKEYDTSVKEAIERVMSVFSEYIKTTPYFDIVWSGTEDGDETVERLAQLFSKDFFDLVIVDECHRGSAKKESNWRKILEYFSSATQIGMTATPKETKYVSNIDYFGEPVYVYSLKDGIEDGFLAPFKVINITTDIGDGWRPRKGQLDIYGHEIPDRIYNNRDYDYSELQRLSSSRTFSTMRFCSSNGGSGRISFLNISNGGMFFMAEPLLLSFAVCFRT